MWFYVLLDLGILYLYENLLILLFNRTFFNMVLVNLKKQTITMKTLFFFIVFSLSLTLNAQLTKGDWLVGGSGEYTNQNYEFDNGDSYKREYITIKPSIGYFLKISLL